MKITKRFLEKNIREVISEILKEGTEEGHNYEHTSLTGEEKDNFAIKTGLGEILRIVAELEEAGDKAAAMEVIENIKNQLKPYADSIMKKRLNRGRDTQNKRRTAKKEG